MQRSGQGSAPVVIVPGIGHVDRGWALLRRLLEREGFTDVSVATLSTDSADIPRLAGELARHVEALRSLTDSTHVHLVGHHVGGIVARYYVQVLGGHEAVTTLVTVATPHAGSYAPVGDHGPAVAQLRPGSSALRRLEQSDRPLPVRFVNYFSDPDIFVQPSAAGMVKSPLLGATNVLVAGHGHLSVVIPPTVCRSITHELAASEGRGAQVASLPGAVVRLETSSAAARSAPAEVASGAAEPTVGSKLMRLVAVGR